MIYRMTGYTKLFGSIIASTIWREDDKTRIVWITMLAISNKNGIVEASVPGLADLSRVTVEETRAAISKLESPDPDSRSKEAGGRRIKPVDGGWQLVNHAKYRAKLNADERRQYLTQKKRDERAKDTVSTNVNNCRAPSTVSTHTEAEAATDTKYHSDTRSALWWLNEKAGIKYREVHANLSLISARLQEAEVTLDGVKEMIEHQVASWKGSDMEKYLRPETLFGKSKFDSYYANRKNKIIGRGDTHRVDRAKGTLNEGVAQQYNLRKIQAQSTLQDARRPGACPDA